MLYIFYRNKPRTILKNVSRSVTTATAVGAGLDTAGQVTMFVAKVNGEIETTILVDLGILRASNMWLFLKRQRDIIKVTLSPLGADCSLILVDFGGIVGPPTTTKSEPKHFQTKDSNIYQKRKSRWML